MSDSITRHSAFETIRILLVDQDAQSTRMVREMISSVTSPHYEIAEAASVAEALSCFRMSFQHDAGVDAVLIDLGPGEPPGLDQVAALRKAAPSLPLVVVSGGKDETIGAQTLAAGAQAPTLLPHPHVEDRPVLRARHHRERR